MTITFQPNGNFAPPVFRWAHVLARWGFKQRTSMKQETRYRWNIEPHPYKAGLSPSEIPWHNKLLIALGLQNLRPIKVAVTSYERQAVITPFQFNLSQAIEAHQTNPKQSLSSQLIEGLEKTKQLPFFRTVQAALHQQLLPTTDEHYITHEFNDDQNIADLRQVKQHYGLEEIGQMLLDGRHMITGIGSIADHFLLEPEPPTSAQSDLP